MRLTARGYTVINDERTFEIGDNIVEAVFDRGIGIADSCVIVLSATSISRPWPREELAAAVAESIQRSMLLLPVLLDDIKVPTSLRAKVYLKVGNRRDPDEIERIAERIDHAMRRRYPPNESTASMDTQKRNRVVRELLVTLQSHFESLRPLFFHRSVDLPRWKAAHDDIVARAQRDDVNDALGDDYPAFMKATRSEAINLRIEAKHQAEYLTRIIDSDGKELPGAELAKREYGALFLQILADTIIAYAPWVAKFGDKAMADEYLSSAERWTMLAQHTLSNQ